MIKAEGIYLPRIGDHIVYNTASSGDVIGVCSGYKIWPGLGDDHNIRLFVEISNTDLPLKTINSRLLQDVRAAEPDEVKAYYMRKCIPDIKQREEIIQALIKAGFTR